MDTYAHQKSNHIETSYMLTSAEGLKIQRTWRMDSSVIPETVLQIEGKLVEQHMLPLILLFSFYPLNNLQKVKSPVTFISTKLV